MKAKIHPLTNTILTCWFKPVLRAKDISIFRTLDQVGLCQLVTRPEVRGEEAWDQEKRDRLPNEKAESW